MTQESPTHEPSRSALRLELAVIAAIVYIASILILGWPALFFGIGVNSLGGELGWWRGDSNLNDTDYAIALPIGIVSLAVVALLAAVLVRAAGRRYRLSAVIPVAIGTGVLVAMFVAAATLAVTAQPVG